jgi:hypothetical protein
LPGAAFPRFRSIRLWPIGVRLTSRFGWIRTWNVGFDSGDSLKRRKGHGSEITVIRPVFGNFRLRIDLSHFRLERRYVDSIPVIHGRAERYEQGFPFGIAFREPFPDFGQLLFVARHRPLVVRRLDIGALGGFSRRSRCLGRGGCRNCLGGSADSASDFAGLDRSGRDDGRPLGSSHSGQGVGNPDIPHHDGIPLLEFGSGISAFPIPLGDHERGNFRADFLVAEIDVPELVPEAFDPAFPMHGSPGVDLSFERFAELTLFGIGTLLRDGGVGVQLQDVFFGHKKWLFPLPCHKIGQYAKNRIHGQYSEKRTGREEAVL